jgi:PAS domain S-box-containing protein
MATILLVDDRPPTRDHLATLLGQAGHGVLQAGDRTQALALARTRRPDLILANVNLPGLDGPELLRQLHADPASAGIPVLFWTAGQSDDLVRAFASAERARLLLDSTAEAIFSVDLQGRCTFCNAACVRRLGYREPGQLLGQDMHALIYHTRPNGSPCPWEQGPINQALENGVEPQATEQTFWRADGTSFPAECWSHPICQDGRVVGLVVTFIDITERKQLERQFLQSQKMEAVGRLAGGVAHDFNNLLTIINGYCELLIGGLHSDDPLRNHLEQIFKAGQRAAGLTRQLLAFSRKQVMVPEVIDLGALLAEMEKMISRLIGEDIELKLSAQPDLWTVKVDPGQIEQVIMNLVINARDAMPEGGKLTIEMANVELDEHFTRLHPETPPGQYLLIAVSDTGTGMDEATRARVFEPFFTTKGPEKGTGLGLATAYGIIKKSGGRIDVYTELGRGTTFKIYLPHDRGWGPHQRSPSLHLVHQPGKETVLLVEDEEGVRNLAKLVLQMQGYTVLEARNGGEGLLLCRQHQGPIHIMLTDVVIPHMSGPALAEYLAPLRPDMKVLFLSGYTDDAIVHHGVLAQGTPFLQKPFMPAALAKKVREVLDQEPASR